MRQTFTYDQGKEMAHAKSMLVYFYDPQSHLAVGSYENTNGLLSQFLPKESDFSIHDQDALDAIADLMNKKPR